jgi:hypothetical protein
MVFQLVLSHGLTVQSLVTIIFGGVSLATEPLLNAQTCLIKPVDIFLCSSTMSLSALFPSPFQVSRPTGGSRLEYLVCLSLVSYRAKYSTSLLQNLTCILGSQEDTRGRLRMPCASMAMSFASLLTSLFSSPRKLSSVCSKYSILTFQ